MFIQRLIVRTLFKNMLLYLIIVYFAVTLAAPVNAQEATPTSVIPPCATETSATPEITSTAEATSEADEATDEAALEVTSEATPEATAEAGSDIVRFPEFEPYDLKFNPTVETAFAVITNYTLYFENQLTTELELRKPQFRLSIEGVEWGELVSTDFQMGKVQAKATHGIALQKLMLIRNTTPEQLAILGCIAEHQPVNALLEGTIDIYPDGELQTLEIEMPIEGLVFEPTE